NPPRLETDMADGSLTNTSNPSIELESPLYGPSLAFGEEFFIPLQFDRSDVDSELLFELASRLSRFAASTLYIARLRGENDNDPPGTLDGALGAAEMCMQLANGFNAAGLKLQKGN